MTEATKQNLLNKLVVHYGLTEGKQDYNICEYMLDNGAICGMDGYKIATTEVHTRICVMRKKGVPIITKLIKQQKKKPYAMWYLDVDRIEASV